MWNKDLSDQLVGIGTASDYTYSPKCRMCKSTDMVAFLDMGKQPLVNSLLSKEDLNNPEYIRDLTMYHCNSCGLNQIADVMSAKEIYQDADYLYFSSDVKVLGQYYEDYFQETISKYIKEDDLIIEIGSNDGLLLDIIYMSGNFEVFGIDAVPRAVLRCLKKGIPAICHVFDSKIAKKVKDEYGQASVIIINNCMAHIEDLHDFMHAIDILLQKNGVLIVEDNYWAGMKRNNNYGLVYHDHYSYFTVDTVDKFVKMFNFKIIHAAEAKAQDGTIRLVIARNNSNFEEDDSAQKMIRDEYYNATNTIVAAEAFAESTYSSIKKLKSIIEEVIKSGGKIAGYGASSKGFVILNSLGLKEGDLICIIDDAPIKQEKHAPVTHTPIVSREKAKNFDFDHMLILAWNYRDIIMKNEQEFKDKGGKFIIPMGEIGII